MPHRRETLFLASDPPSLGLDSSRPSAARPGVSPAWAGISLPSSSRVRPPPATSPERPVAGRASASNRPSAVRRGRHGRVASGWWRRAEDAFRDGFWIVRGGSLMRQDVVGSYRGSRPSDEEARGTRVSSRSGVRVASTVCGRRTVERPQPARYPGPAIDRLGPARGARAGDAVGRAPRRGELGGGYGV